MVCMVRGLPTVTEKEGLGAASPLQAEAPLCRITHFSITSESTNSLCTLCFRAREACVLSFPEVPPPSFRFPHTLERLGLAHFCPWNVLCHWAKFYMCAFQQDSEELHAATEHVMSRYCR